MTYPFLLGDWSRRISTESDAAQVWFDRGLNWTYGYNQEEAVACFRRALEHDSKCAMAWWGVAYAAGPFYNRPWIRYSETEIAATLTECHDAITQAMELVLSCTKTEAALIRALARRYQFPAECDVTVLMQWQFEYADAMRSVAARFDDDPDIAALYVEAAVTCTPRQLWDLPTGQPKETARTAEVLPVLERWMARLEHSGMVHPGLAHMQIHALEMSPFPEEANTAADMLVGLAPDAGHLEHMAAHVYVLCGDYERAVVQSERAVVADDKYFTYAGDQNFYTTARCHDLHLFMYAAMFLGQYKKAIYAADRMAAMATTDLIAASAPFMASILDGYAAMRIHVLVRFGRWQELIELQPPADPELRPIGEAMHAYGCGVANAALGNVPAAQAARTRLQEAKAAFAPDAVFLSNTVRDMLSVAEAMLDGELAYRTGEFETAFRCLRRAVVLDDALNFTEPWAWMHPPRHALGALLLEQGHCVEAEQVFLADLGLTDVLARPCQHPDNVWALKGLVACLKNRNDVDAAPFEKRLEQALLVTDTPIQSACFCSGHELVVSGGTVK